MKPENTKLEHNTTCKYLGIKEVKVSIINQKNKKKRIL